MSRSHEQPVMNAAAAGGKRMLGQADGWMHCQLVGELPDRSSHGINTHATTMRRTSDDLTIPA